MIKLWVCIFLLYTKNMGRSGNAKKQLLSAAKTKIRSKSKPGFGNIAKKYIPEEHIPDPVFQEDPNWDPSEEEILQFFTKNVAYFSPRGGFPSSRKDYLRIKKEERAGNRPRFNMEYVRRLWNAEDKYQKEKSLFR